MKRNISILLVLLLLFSFVGCGSESGISNNTDSKKVGIPVIVDTTKTLDFYELTKAINNLDLYLKHYSSVEQCHYKKCTVCGHIITDMDDVFTMKDGEPNYDDSKSKVKFDPCEHYVLNKTEGKAENMKQETKGNITEVTFKVPFADDSGKEGYELQTFYLDKNAGLLIKRIDETHFDGQLIQEGYCTETYTK